jgi:hypothetical protein
MQIYCYTTRYPIATYKVIALSAQIRALEEDRDVAPPQALMRNHAMVEHKAPSIV